MLSPVEFLGSLRRHDISFFAGVPDSLLKDFCGCVADEVPAENHCITANEGAAVALAAGYHLSTGRSALVYMQNSGIGNAVNPLLSLVDPDVYSVPLLLLIGWRGEPGEHDEPQHRKQGRVMLAMLESMEIDYEILPDTHERAEEAISRLLAVMHSKSGPVALIVRDGTFNPYKYSMRTSFTYQLAREAALSTILANLSLEDVVVATTGKASREIYEYRDLHGQSHSNDFLTVGSMGHSSQIALGIALHRPERTVYCIDGDGAAIMHMGGLAFAGSAGPVNFRHIILNNGVHDSVGGQPTCGFSIDFTAIARGCGYTVLPRADDRDSLANGMKALACLPGPAFLEVRVSAGSRQNLGRPKTTPIENKRKFMELLAR